MKLGGGMLWVCVLVACGVIVIGAAAYQSSTKDQNDYTQLLSESRELAAQNKKLAQRLTDVENAVAGVDKNLADSITESTQRIQEILDRQKTFQTDHLILQQRYHALDKKLIAKEKTILHKFTEPLPVEIRPAPTKGKGKGSLLERATKGP